MTDASDASAADSPVSPVNLSTAGPGETVLDPEPAVAYSTLKEALNLKGAKRHTAISAIVYRWPGFLDGWAHLGECARDDMEAYASFRVGYHRGLDRLRQNGWRGSGFVRWSHKENRGFLRSLEGLRRTAEKIGEVKEASRCADFLMQLDPSWSPANLKQFD